ncbi:NusG domain II-containing protein [Parachitinimonas caeni]|uniref:NusG domain II-containing protein n=1 Tax=Parachitinimonas caeni TaxID=3031301 RepID=A0ABT7DSY6_9NEIS|nr:NusG domain II-containing protein [Parachitinimonas caeni]MDK2123186.1 NusG domain II-containing protein [Parachitinimonas caeni]
MKIELSDWRQLLRPGDYVLLLFATVAVAASYPLAWRSQQNAQRVRIFANGTLFAERDLSGPARLAVPGPLGDTIVEIADGRVRIAADPGPRQYCVNAGWLEHAGQLAVCLPNRTAIELPTAVPRYDSLSY